MDENRLIAIETKVAHQEHTVGELSSLVFEQQKQIEALEVLSRKLADRIRELYDALQDQAAPDEKPPHY